MRQIKSSFLLLLLLTAAATARVSSASFFGTYSQYETIISLSHSILTRISNIRAARGDVTGATRAKLIAEKLEQGFWGLVWPVSFDYLRNYAWRDLDYKELRGVVSDLNDLAVVLTQLTRTDSDVQKAAWIGRNYSKILGIAKSVIQKFLKVFNKSGALKKVVETVQREVVDGELLRDCIELGGYDLKGLVQIVKDLASQFHSSTSNSEL